MSTPRVVLKMVKMVSGARREVEKAFVLGVLGVPFWPFMSHLGAVFRIFLLLFPSWSFFGAFYVNFGPKLALYESIFAAPECP